VSAERGSCHSPKMGRLAAGHDVIHKYSTLYEGKGLRMNIQSMCFGVVAVVLVGACGVLEPSVEDQGLSGAGAAEQTLSGSGEGPFTNVQALVNYWGNTPMNGAMTQIYLNGKKVYERQGFGPAFVKQYFESSGSTIYAVCPSGIRPGYTNFDTLVSRAPAGAWIYRDSVLVRQGTNAASVDISTCLGDQSYYGPVSYFRVIDYYNPPAEWGNTCYL